MRYVAGEIDQVQGHDELMRWYRPDIIPAADMRLLPPEQPGRVCPYAAEMAALMVKMNDLPPYVFRKRIDVTRYNTTRNLPFISNYYTYPDN